jgi:hypothetical protein
MKYCFYVEGVHSMMDPCMKVGGQCFRRTGRQRMGVVAIEQEQQVDESTCYYLSAFLLFGIHATLANLIWILYGQELAGDVCLNGLNIPQLRDGSSFPLYRGKMFLDTPLLD